MLQVIMLRAALVFCLAAVVVMGRPDEGHGNSRPEAQSDQDTSQDNSVSMVNTANKEFSFRLYSALASQPDSRDKNIFLSPVSVSVALAALSVGARGDTHEQLFTGLGFNSLLLNQSQVNQAFRACLHKNVSQDATQGTAVFVDNKFKPNPEFLDSLKQSYLTDGFTVDFTKTTESADTINNYVSDKTNGKIDKMVDSLGDDTVMYLLSYIYFKGKWQKPFDPQSTREDTFEVDENTQVPVQMMNEENNFQVYYDQAINTSVLHLPFNSSYSMLLMLPAEMETLEKAISPSYVTKWLKWMKSKRYNVFIPKFSIKTSYSLKEVLSEMGMTDMFGDRADLSGLAAGNKLAVSEVVHKAALDVDEKGATAAAATGVTITLLSFRYVPVLKYNHPFMLLILDRATQDIMFMGKIINPNI
ncbi:alpha-1-antitrypsin homolog [Boleophthalmus pectinirostris]|uniref:alpha-1-antitrypsin homolog n=1 Tax=Boleophthalmus pectinirostris TaxID=150288 RepID=UPI000A1C2789|nr:alpha-1-antitrypsin homolog [Boleophthalmus pectinirostris]